MELVIAPAAVVTATRGHVSTLPRPWKSLRNCAIIHPLHLELETALGIVRASVVTAV